MKKIITTQIFILVLTLLFGPDLLAQRFRLEEYSNQEIDLQFDAVKVENSIKFVWSTGSQIDIKAYELRKGYENGLLVDWETIATINAKEAKNTYQFIDQNPLLGEMHYRLKLLAADGSSFEYSPIFKIQQNEMGRHEEKEKFKY